VDRGTIGQVGHVLHGHDLGDVALVAVTAGHLVALGDLALLGDAHSHQLVDARRQLVVLLAREDSDVDDFARLAVWNTERAVLYLARLLTKDGAQQALLGGQLGFALGSDLAYQDVARANLGPDVDDAPLVEVLEAFLADVGDVARDLLGTQLGIPSLDLVLFNMYGREQVLADHTLADDDGVLKLA